MLSSQLNSRIDVYEKTENINELGEKTFSYGMIKSVWAEVLPNGNADSQKDGQGNTIYADVSHKITVRAGAISNLTNDMYFMFRGQRYDIKYFMPNYKQRDRVEIYCSLVVE